MKIKKIRIKNYKSIVDSGDCYLEDDLTIFAGKNESGKTSILEALDDFNIAKGISPKARPIGREDDLPEISITFLMSQYELEEYYDNLNINYDEIEVKGGTEINVTKTFPNQYSVDANSLDDWELLKAYVPNFILFKSFDDTWPDSVSFPQLGTDVFIKDLSLISDLDISLIQSGDERLKKTHKRNLSFEINDEYTQFWEQDNTEINIDWNSNTLFFWVVEDSKDYRPSERSKGKQWHMSFYIRVTARTNEEKENVILIDEPGLFLHASAQNDVYRKLTVLSKQSQILFTTHSPYLLNKDELNKIRLVFKNDTVNQGSIIKNKIHALADKETLTPILTAIGLGLGDGIQNVSQEKNIVVEGISDYFYLQGIKNILNEKTFNIISGGGAGNMGNVGTILTGWGGKVVYLFDNDKGAKDGQRNLEKNWHVSKELIQTISDKKGSIEDMFSVSDFRKYVLGDSSIKYQGSNSSYIRQKKLDKVLLSKHFAEETGQASNAYTKETTKAFQLLFKKLSSLFSENNT